MIVSLGKRTSVTSIGVSMVTGSLNASSSSGAVTLHRHDLIRANHANLDHIQRIRWQGHAACACRHSQRNIRLKDARPHTCLVLCLIQPEQPFLVCPQIGILTSSARRRHASISSLLVMRLYAA